MLGTSAIKVYRLLTEFIAANIPPPPTEGKKVVYTDEFYEKFILAKIVDLFLIKTKNDEIKIFDAINDAYATQYGIENFIEYQEILEADKNRGFHGLASIFEKRKRFYEKKSSVI